ncbi:MAG: SoxR reducing system RseC family protein [Prevotellaceae bacterium]|jgi:sigma-E factor negative regulatory protein RseC|nr:SoxR reducing system RseC family protein [Prevotellaceae bacterium]
MADIIEHQGIVENIDGNHLSVRIVQTSACAACGARGHCAAADTKEKLIEVTTPKASDYQVGQQVMVYGALSMGMKAVWWAFLLPLLVLMVALVVLLSIWSEPAAAIGSLVWLIPYYYIVWFNRRRMSRKFSFSVRPMPAPR